MTERPSVTATPVAKVNELSGNYSGPAKFVSLQVCLHLMSSALSIGGWSGLRAPFHRNYNDSVEKETWARTQLRKAAELKSSFCFMFTRLISAGMNI